MARGAGMDSRQRLNIALLVLVAVLAALAWYESTRAPAGAPPLIALTPEAVHKIEIRRADRDTLMLTRQDGAWWLREPVRIEADRFQVDGVLRMLAATSLAHFPAADRDLAAYGLAAPAVRVRFNDVDIAFGELSPVDQRRYVRIGDEVHLIDDSYFLDLTADVAAFVGRRLVPASQRVVALELPGLRLEQDSGGRWHTTPPDGLASADARQRLVDAWRDAEALAAERYIQAPSAGEVVIGLAGQAQPLRYVIVAADDGGVLARPELGLQFRLTDEQVRRLLARDDNDGGGVPPAP